MNNLKEILLSEVEEIRSKGYKFLNGELSIMDFKHSSGGFGIYAQRGKKDFMIRLRIPSGMLSMKDLKQVYSWAKQYDLDKIHLTTRQAIQYHGLDIDEVCNIMKEGIEKSIYTRGGGGNFPRNVAMSPLSGVDPKEIFDVSPYASAVGNHFLKKMYTYKLPRKLKVSFSNSNADDAHCTVQDLGFLAVEKEGKQYFNVYSGGGLGRNPRKAIIVADMIEPKDVLYHIEAMTNMFIAEGDYNNRSKARIRYILDRLGEEEYIKCYHKHLEEVKSKECLDLNVAPKNTVKVGIENNIKHKRLFKQKQQGLYSVYFHPIGGMLMLSHLKELMDALEEIEDVELRLTMDEGLYIINLNGKEAEKVLEITQGKGGETKAQQSISCIGVPICQMGIANSQCALHNFVKLVKEKALKEDSLPKVRFSGCGNSCSVHEVGEIGLAGKIKRVNNESKHVFELYIDGDYAVEKTKLGKYYGDILADEVANFLVEVGETVEALDKDFYNWIDSEVCNLKEILNKYLV
ncbi:nitrite/sulfite reductase [Clostridium tarantellae]|uniref:Nitrite/sulfite reductase n=1 Tax=Clostridium tarantellae TaxID=39493 RepID=A0A6I1MN13_9CLOT|nr:nitrite/sulfite reductase [Clostridium tarantellae]MPQ44785.1 nitrite/sulfite reductase [Clostridium tarantellae]